MCDALLLCFGSFDFYIYTSSIYIVFVFYPDPIAHVSYSVYLFFFMRRSPSLFVCHVTCVCVCCREKRGGVWRGRRQKERDEVCGVWKRKCIVKEFSDRWSCVWRFFSTYICFVRIFHVLPPPPLCVRVWRAKEKEGGAGGDIREFGCNDVDVLSSMGQFSLRST